MFPAKIAAQTVLLLTLYAWYGHLRTISARPWIIAAFVNWGVTLFEYLPQVSANRIGYTQFKVAQKVIVVIPFAAFYIGIAK